MGQGSSQLLTHMWIMKMAQKPWYITKKGNKRKKKREVKETQQQKERKNPKPLIILLGHNRGCFLYWCMCNSFPLTLSTNIFSLNSDQLFLPLSTNLLFGLFGTESIPILGSSQNWSLHTHTHTHTHTHIYIYIYIFSKKNVLFQNNKS